jgi:HK97 family phage prohead protease
MLKHVVPFEVKETLNEEGVFAGYGAVFGNVDLGRDVIAPGSFSESLAKWKAKGKLPKMFWQHNARQPIGKWLEMNEDSYGLFCRGRLTKGVQTADEARLLMLDDALDGLSIGFDTIEDQYDNVLNVRKLIKLDLWEVSPVSLPMNPAATISAVKALADGLQGKDWRDVEAALRDEGLSRADAVKAVSGFRNWLKRDAGAPASTPRDEVVAEEFRKALNGLAEHIKASAA